MMFKNFFKMLAAVTGLSVIGYFLMRKLDIWELGAAKQAPEPLDPALAAEDTAATPSAPPAKVRPPQRIDEPRQPGKRAQAEAKLEAELAAKLQADPAKAPAKDTTSQTASDQKTPAKPASSEAGTPAASIDFSTIGTAGKAQQDNLKKIKGIGEALEKKLHKVGIFTYQQIANFTPEVEEQVAEAISLFPGRIERDEWVSQAKVLLKKKKA